VSRRECTSDCHFWSSQDCGTVAFVSLKEKESLRLIEHVHLRRRVVVLSLLLLLSLLHLYSAALLLLLLLLLLLYHDRYRLVHLWYHGWCSSRHEHAPKESHRQNEIDHPECLWKRPIQILRLPFDASLMQSIHDDGFVTAAGFIGIVVVIVVVIVQ
jgi:hypothetical protein